ncbi:transposase family protein [Streptomyces sp. NPDC094438]|uniref:transposase family protein n=1 Tax=Streptomyces sp. NPDC094438 TaxID=3366061 RepID=UPI003811900F
MQVETVEAVEGLVRITVWTHAGVPASCPGCGQASSWEHSRYVRHVADEAVGGRPVMVDLSVRRTYCENPDCSKQTLAQQVEGLTVGYQRRTPALPEVVEAVARALVGTAGARLLLHLHQARLTAHTALKRTGRTRVDRGNPAALHPQRLPPHPRGDWRSAARRRPSLWPVTCGCGIFSGRSRRA